MKIVLVRHAIAEDRDAFAATGAPDDERPLTKEGKKRMKRAARGLRELLDDLDMVVTSPLVRAVKTAEIIADVYDAVPPVPVPFLSPGSQFEPFLEWIKRLDDVQTLVAVGHEPHLSRLVAWLVTGHEQAFFEMKKSSAVLLEFNGDMREGGAQLRWFLTPAQLRFIGDQA